MYTKSRTCNSKPAAQPNLRRCAATLTMGTSLPTMWIHATEIVDEASGLSGVVRIWNSQHETQVVRENTSRTTCVLCRLSDKHPPVHSVYQCDIQEHGRDWF